MIFITLNMPFGIGPMSLRILQQKNTVEVNQDESAGRLHRGWDRHHAFLDCPIFVMLSCKRIRPVGENNPPKQMIPKL